MAGSVFYNVGNESFIFSIRYEIMFALIINKAAAYLLMAGISRLIDVTRSNRKSLPSSHAEDSPGK